MPSLITLKWSEHNITYQQTEWEERRHTAFYKRRTINRWPPPFKGPFLNNPWNELQIIVNTFMKGNVLVWFAAAFFFSFVAPSSLHMFPRTLWLKLFQTIFQRQIWSVIKFTAQSARLLISSLNTHTHTGKREREKQRERERDFNGGGTLLYSS